MIMERLRYACSPGITGYKTVMVLFIWHGIVLDNDRTIPVSPEFRNTRNLLEYCIINFVKRS